MIDLENFADRMGIARDYVDCTGKPTIISSDARMATLQAMGYDLSDNAALEERALKEELLPYQEILDPVCVIREGERPFIYMRTPENLSEAAQLTWNLVLEDGTEYCDTVPLEEIEIADYITVQDRTYDIRRIILPDVLRGSTSGKMIRRMS